MNFSVPVGNGHIVEYIGNFFTGAEQLKADGAIIFQRFRESEEQIYDYGPVRNEFVIGTNDPIKVALEIDRPFFYRGIRPYTYRVFADGKLLHEVTGF